MYVGAEKHTAEKVGFRHLSHTNLLTSIAYKLKQLLTYVLHAQNDIAFIVVAPFSLFVKGQGSDVCLLHMCTSHANAFYRSSLMMVAFEVLTESLSIRHLVAHDR